MAGRTTSVEEAARIALRAKAEDAGGGAENQADEASEDEDAAASTTPPPPAEAAAAEAESLFICAPAPPSCVRSVKVAFDTFQEAVVSPANIPRVIVEDNEVDAAAAAAVDGGGPPCAG